MTWTRLVLLQFLYLWHLASTIKILSHDGACKAKTDQGYIDITSLGNTDGTAKFMDIRDNNRYQISYDFNPCKDFSVGSGGTGTGCKNVAVCIVTSGLGVIDYENMGTTSSAKWGVSQDGNITISYSEEAFSAVIKLFCSKDSTADSVKVEQQNPPSPASDANLVLKSSHCCPGAAPVTTPSPSSSSGLGIGSILCISLIVVICLYIAGGLAFTMGYKKNQGRERIPNVELWSSLPGLVKDGVRYSVCCGFRSGGGGAKYDQL